MKTQFLIASILLAVACSHPPVDKVTVLESDSLTRDTEKKVVMNSEDLLGKNMSQVDSVESKHEKEVLQICPEFRKLAQQYWKSGSTENRTGWESDYDTFELLIEEAQCMVGMQLGQLKEVLGSIHRSETIDDIQLVYYRIEFKVRHSGDVSRVDLLIRSEVATKVVQSVALASSSTVTTEWD